jgi:CubicO group peptidase (beta-lactamase class C family)
MLPVSRRQFHSPAVALPNTLEILQRGIADGLHPGAQLYVSRRGEVLADLAFGEARPGVPLRPDSIMRWLSSGKPLLAVAIALLHEEGKLSLDAPVATVLPDFAYEGKGAITIQHLLTHTGGFRAADTINDQPELTWETVVARVCAAPLEPNWVPGEKAGYHVSASWVVLAEIIRVLTGVTADAFVREHICRPCGMADSWLALSPEQVRAYGDRMSVLHATDASNAQRHRFWGNPEVGVPLRPGGSACGPVRELGKFYETLLNGHLLQPETLRCFTQRTRVGMFDHTFKHTMDFALGFIVNSNRYGAETVPYGYGRHASEAAFGHSGAQTSCAFADPEHGLVVAWATNGAPGEVRHQRRQRAINSAIYEDLGFAR